MTSFLRKIFMLFAVWRVKMAHFALIFRRKVTGWFFEPKAPPPGVVKISYGRDPLSVAKLKICYVQYTN